MKNLTLTLAIAICSSLLFSSCSKLGSLTITKRHYRSGFYVDMSGSKKAPEHQSYATAKIKKPAVIASVPEVRQEPMIIKELNFKNPVAQNRKAEIVKKASTTVTEYVYASTMDEKDFIVEMQQAEFENYISSLPDIDIQTSDNAETVPYWLMIVFCIILPPLAVGLKFGIVDKFWISILLTLLFWIPGVIYALILIVE